MDWGHVQRLNEPSVNSHQFHLSHWNFDHKLKPINISLYFVSELHSTFIRQHHSRAQQTIQPLLFVSTEFRPLIWLDQSIGKQIKHEKHSRDGGYFSTSIFQRVPRAVSTCLSWAILAFKWVDEANHCRKCVATFSTRQLVIYSWKKMPANWHRVKKKFGSSLTQPLSRYVRSCSCNFLRAAFRTSFRTPFAEDTDTGRTC